MHETDRVALEKIKAARAEHREEQIANGGAPQHVRRAQRVRVNMGRKTRRRGKGKGGPAGRRK